MPSAHPPAGDPPHPPASIVFTALFGQSLKQILQARARREKTPLIVRIVVPDQPGLTLDVFLRVDNPYIFGIQNCDTAFYFSDADGQWIMRDQRLLPFSGHYSNLGSYAHLKKIDRGTITAALTQLAHWQKDRQISNRKKEPPEPTTEARALLLLILIVSEAARFYEIEFTIANALDGKEPGPLTPQGIHTLTHRWDYLSSVGDYRVAIRNLSP